MNKNQLVKRIAKKSGLQQKQVDLFLRTQNEVAKEELREGKAFVIPELVKINPILKKDITYDLPNQKPLKKTKWLEIRAIAMRSLKNKVNKIL